MLLESNVATTWQAHTKTFLERAFAANVLKVGRGKGRRSVIVDKDMVYLESGVLPLCQF